MVGKCLFWLKNLYLFQNAQLLLAAHLYPTLLKAGMFLIPRTASFTQQKAWPPASQPSQSPGWEKQEPANANVENPERGERGLTSEVSGDLYPSPLAFQMLCTGAHWQCPSSGCPWAPPTSDSQRENETEKERKRESLRGFTVEQAAPKCPMFLCFFRR